MYYRRKILLSILQVFNDELEKIILQKLLILFSELQNKPDYHFIPYKYGCFSFQANADLKTMVKYRQITEKGNYWEKTDERDYVSDLKETDRKALRTIKILYGNKSKNELIHIIYTKFPYYAINSDIAHEMLSETEYKIVSDSRPNPTGNVLYTIGYEGISIEEYINKLILNGVKVLCDVRKNPISMKYGFSKSQLQYACEGVGINYLHIADFGIDSTKRKELHTQTDYNVLFQQYRKNTLSKTRYQQENLIKLLKTHERIALTCFEANVFQCHRKSLAEELTKLSDFTFELKHI